MTTSAIRYGDGVIFIKDSELREFLKAITVNLSACSDVVWLIEVCNGWMDDHENLPPGLRDIELDDALTDAARKSSFRNYLSALMTAESDEEAYDLKVACGVIERIISKLL